MKLTNRLYALALILLLPMCVTLVADQKDEVTHGSTSVQASAAEWWDIPYPDRFDRARLSRQQDIIGIEGKSFVDQQGDEFVFRGVNIADPDKLMHQDRWNESLFQEVERWGANSIRLPIHPVAWRKRGPDWYFSRIDEAVEWANALGMYLIIDWHSIGNLESEMYQHPMYVTSKVETRDFWRRIAHRYKDVPTMAVYELFNEPTDDFIGAGKGSLGTLDWDTWRATLEELIDIVQVYDPAVISLVGGFNWAYDLSPVAEKPIRREGVAYAAHAYPQKAKPEQNTREAFFSLWQDQWAFVADHYPIIASEIGWVREDGFNAHVPVINNDGTYGPNLMNFMHRKGISWTVWNFDPDWSPTMISDWDFTPTEQGRFFRDMMLQARAGNLRSSVIPSPRVTEYAWMSLQRWHELHREDIEVARSDEVEVLFLGDSITEGWPAVLLESRFGDYRVANFGIGGDQTQNVIWRLQNGTTGNLDPELVVLMIGINNIGLGGDQPADVAAGVQAVIDQVKQSFAGAEILLLGILPEGEQPATPTRQQVRDTNDLLAKMAEDPRVHYQDIGAAFLLSDGTISSEIMADFLHPTEKGYEVFADQLAPLVDSLME